MPLGSMVEARDPLSEVLGVLSLRGEVFCRTQMAKRRGIEFPPGKAHFHYVEEGACWLRVGERSPPVRADEGDLVMLIGGPGHTLQTDPELSAATPLEEAVAEGFELNNLTLRVGDAPAKVGLICGRFSIETIASQALVEVLPDLIHVPSQAQQPYAWLAPILEQLTVETDIQAPGWLLSTSRLVDLVLVGAIRYWIDHQESEVGGWIGALRDPKVGLTIGLMHGDPAHPWSVDELAAAVDLSRSPYASRFTTIVGEPPIRYLTRLRMRLAIKLLDEGQTVKATAERVGYESEEAFSRVFKRHTGSPPSTYRSR